MIGSVKHGPKRGRIGLELEQEFGPERLEWSGTTGIGSKNFFCGHFVPPKGNSGAFRLELTTVITTATTIIIIAIIIVTSALSLGMARGDGFL